MQAILRILIISEKHAIVPGPTLFMIRLKSVCVAAECFIG